MTPVAAIAIVGTVSAFVAVEDLRRWWCKGRVLARLDHEPDRRTAPALVIRALAQAGVDGDPRLLLDCWLGALALSLAAAPFIAGSVVAFLVVAIGPPAALAATRRRGDRLRAAQVPAALDAVAGHLRGGAAITTAIRDAAETGGPIGREFETVARHARDGVPLAVAIEAWGREHDDETSLAAAALTMAASIGGPGAAAVESAAASLRQRAAAANEVAALSVQARLSSIVLSVAPIGFTFLLVSLDPRSARFLLATPAGWACIVAGVGLDIAGAWWMQRLVGRAA